VVPLVVVVAAVPGHVDLDDLVIRWGCYVGLIVRIYGKVIMFVRRFRRGQGGGRGLVQGLGLGGS